MRGVFRLYGAPSNRGVHRIHSDADRCLFDEESDHELHRFVHADNKMRELDIWTEGRDVLSQVEFIGRLRRCWDNPLRLTLFEITDDFRGRIVARMIIRVKRGYLEGGSVLEIQDVTELSRACARAPNEPRLLAMELRPCHISVVQLPRLVLGHSHTAAPVSPDLVHSGRLLSLTPLPRVTPEHHLPIQPGAPCHSVHAI